MHSPIFGKIDVVVIVVVVVVHKMHYPTLSDWFCNAGSIDYNRKDVFI